MSSFDKYYVLIIFSAILVRAGREILYGIPGYIELFDGLLILLVLSYMITCAIFWEQPTRNVVENKIEEEELKDATNVTPWSENQRP